MQENLICIHDFKNLGKVRIEREPLNLTDTSHQNNNNPTTNITLNNESECFPLRSRARQIVLSHTPTQHLYGSSNQFNKTSKKKPKRNKS